MLGFVLLYFIGKSFFTLAKDHDRSRWGYAILGIVIYYAGTIIGGVILGLLTFVFGHYLDYGNDLLLGLITVPFGLLAWWGFYTLLKKNWNKKIIRKDTEILDDELIDEY